jgi:hypothetical protein
MHDGHKNTKLSKRLNRKILTPVNRKTAGISTLRQEIFFKKKQENFLQGTNLKHEK